MSSSADGNQRASKVFNDPIHGHMEFPPLCVRIMDTSQFQRLRYLKQLGGGYFVYPDASHNRFEHSLGVCHLAGLLVNELRWRQPNLRIEKEDVLNVQIAGLCHDLGHGPFSHVFDNKFIAETKPEWKHEVASLAMFDHLVEKNGLKSETKSESGLTADQIETIKELIVGKDPSSNTQKPEWKYKGKQIFQKEDWAYKGKQAFLYEIVANKRNGVDVDKWDYFQRDCHHLGMTSSFDLKRFIKFARVIIDENGESQICYRDKEAFNMYQLFHTRFTLHRRAYQHKTVQAVELMLVDAMKEADTPGDDKKRSISACIDDMDEYTQLTDDIFHRILRGEGTAPESSKKRAKTILENIQKRKLYKCVGEIVVPVLPPEYESRQETTAEDEIKAKIIKADISDEKFRIQVSTLDYGKKAENPVNNVRFYKKDKPDKCFGYENAAEVSFLVPRFCFREKLVRVFYVIPDTKDDEDEQHMKKIGSFMEEWCKTETQEKMKWCEKQKKAKAEEQKKQEEGSASDKEQGGSREKPSASETPRRKFEEFVEHVYKTFCPTYRSMLAHDQ